MNSFCRFFLPLYFAIVALLFCPSLLGAQTDYPDWDPPESIDTGVDLVTGSAGFSIAAVTDGWWIVYEKNGDIYAARNLGSGWGPPTRLTFDPSLQTKPRLASSSSRLDLVWEDHRSDHPEIFYRHYDGTTWTAEQEISGDGIASRAPDIANGYVVWEDSTSLVSKVMGRRFSGTIFEEIELLSNPIVDAREPAVSPHLQDWGQSVFWTDLRHEHPQIYQRSWDPWEHQWNPEQRFTDLARPYGNPAVTLEPSGDVPNMGTTVVFFEGTLPSGTIEVFQDRWNGIQVVSPDDGISSVRPNVDGFNFPFSNCGTMGGSAARAYPTWTDLDVSGARRHTVWGEDPVEGLTVSAIGAIEGDALATVVQVWIAEQGRETVLLSRLGRVPGCSFDRFEASEPLLVGPAGVPTNRVHVFDRCSGESLAGYDLEMFVGASGFRWDPEQESQVEEQTNEEGEAFFSLRGGGCSNQGETSVYCEGVLGGSAYYWHGAKSPDRNADCIVDLDDLAYVEDRLGTDDYCADLDGSGTVTEDDLAIVEMTLWDHCSDVVGIEDLIAAIEPSLYVHPNPARSTVQIRTALPVETVGVLQIIDPGGRLVRAIDLPFDSRQAQTTTWDLRSETGRKVAPGIYFAVLRSDRAGEKIARPILVMP